MYIFPNLLVSYNFVLPVSFMSHITFLQCNSNVGKKLQYCIMKLSRVKKGRKIDRIIWLKLEAYGNQKPCLKYLRFFARKLFVK